MNTYPAIMHMHIWINLDTRITLVQTQKSMIIIFLTQVINNLIYAETIHVLNSIPIAKEQNNQRT